MSPCSSWHTKQFCHIFTPVDQLLCSGLHTCKTDLLRTMSALLRTTLWHCIVCWLIARGAVSTLYSFFKHGHDWCVCLPVWGCVTSQLSRATLMHWVWRNQQVVDQRLSEFAHTQMEKVYSRIILVHNNFFWSYSIFACAMYWFFVIITFFSTSVSLF